MTFYSFPRPPADFDLPARPLLRQPDLQVCCHNDEWLARLRDTLGEARVASPLDSLLGVPVIVNPAVPEGVWLVTPSEVKRLM